MRLSWWMAFIGFFSFFAAMTVVGLQQNSNWWSHINVIETLPVLRVGFVWRAVSGGVVGVAAFIFGYNIIMTFVKGREKHHEEEVVVMRIKPERRSRFQTISQQGIESSYHYFRRSGGLYHHDFYGGGYALYVHLSKSQLAGQ